MVPRKHSACRKEGLADGEFRQEESMRIGEVSIMREKMMPIVRASKGGLRRRRR